MVEKRTFLYNSVYFSIYFTSQMIFTYIYSYFPVYFSTILNIDTGLLAIVLFFSYFALFSKPLISVIFDKVSRIKKYHLFSLALGLNLSFLLLIISLNVMILFGIFLGLVLSLNSIITVVVNKIIITESLSSKQKNKNAFIIQISTILGGILPPIIFIISQWNYFFLTGIIISSILPILVLNWKGINMEKRPVVSENNFSKSRKQIIVMGIYLFFIFSDSLFSYAIKPWITEELNSIIFSVFWLIFILINAGGIGLARITSKRLNSRLILILGSLILGFFYLLTPILDIISFLIMNCIVQLIAGVILFNITSLMIGLSGNRVLYYQIMTLFIITSTLVFGPIGTFFYTIISTQYILFMTGILTLISLLPICYLKDESNNQN